MTSENEGPFFGDERINAYVNELWSNVFIASNKLIKDTEVFGFETIGFIPKPNVHQMLASLSVIDGMLEKILQLSEATGALDTSAIRMIFNARQQILNMERIATALNNGNREGYDDAVAKLQEQAQF